MTSLDSFTMSCLLMCAVGANAQGREAEAMRYLEQIPDGQLRLAEDLLAQLRNHVYLRRQSGVDFFDAEGRPALVAAAVLQPDHASLPEGP